MIVTNLTRLLQLLVLGAAQILLFNHIHLFGYATPLVYVAFLLYFPLDASRTGTLMWGFAMGMIMDVFTNTPGMAAASMTLAALIQPMLLQLMVPKDVVEDMVPNYRTMGRWNHMRYALLITVIHHLAFFTLESFSYHDPIEWLITLGSSLLLSYLLILALETFRGKKNIATA